MHRLLGLPVLLFQISLADGSTTLPKPIEHLARAAISADWLGFYGSVSIATTSYYLFGLQQGQRSGVVVIGDNPEAWVVGADTALSSIHLDQSPEIVAAALRGFSVLLAGKTPISLFGSPAGSSSNASCVPTCPIGDQLDQLLEPITGFHLRTNATREILSRLQESNALSLDPADVVPGSILISPSRYERHGPVSLGAVGIVGADRYVYGTDASGRWRRLAPVKVWLEDLRLTNGVFAFLLRAADGKAGGDLRRLR